MKYCGFVGVFYFSAFVFLQGGFAQLYQINNNALNTYLVPPFPETSKVFQNGFLIQKYSSNRTPFGRNLKSNNYAPFEHQTDWIPITPLPAVEMQSKLDNGFVESRDFEGIINNRNAKMLIGNNKVTPSGLSGGVKTIDGQQEENKHSFVHFKNLLLKKQTSENPSKTYDLDKLRRTKENNIENVVEIFNDKEELSGIIQAKLDILLKKFEGNLSKILDIAVTNVSDATKNRVQRSQYYYNPEDVHRTNGVPLELSRSVQSNGPPTSGTSSPGLINSIYWAGPPTEAGYTSPPNLNLNSNGGTLDYTAQYRGTQEVVHGRSDSTTHGSIQNHRLNNHIIRNYSNIDDNKLPITIVNSQIRINRHKSEAANNGGIDEQSPIELQAKYEENSNSYYNTRHSTTERNSAIERNEINDKTLGQDSKVKRKIGESLSILNEPFSEKNEYSDEENENVNVDEDERVAETIVRDNRVSKRMYPFYRPLDLKGIDTFRNNNNDLIDNLKGVNLLALDQYKRGQKINVGYNSLDHLPPDPLVSVFLSHYGRYIPSGHYLTSNFRNIYSYLASNNIHNNKPFGSYKIYEDTDG